MARMHFRALHFCAYPESVIYLFKRMPDRQACLTVNVTGLDLSTVVRQGQGGLKKRDEPASHGLTEPPASGLSGSCG